jgi:molybdate transport system substrate-binding protein
MNFARALLAASLTAGAATAAPAATITVNAAASLADVLHELGTRFEAESNDRVQFNFAASSLLARQIEEAAPVDVFISADEQWVDWLERKGLLARGTRVSLLSNLLVIIAEKDSRLAISSPRDLASDPVRSLALAETETVPAGIYAKEYLQNLGLWERVKGKVVPTENVRGALAAVESGNADAAIVYRTDARMSKRVRVAYEVPPAQGPKISYGAAVVAASANSAAAQGFLAFLQTPEAARIFERYGFLVPTRK